MAVFQVDKDRFCINGWLARNAVLQRMWTSWRAVSKRRPAQPDNGDFALADKRGSFSKGLKHDGTTGLADPAAFAAFAAALSSKRSAIFGAIEAIDTSHLGAGNDTRPWANPAGGRALAVVGGDPQQFSMPAAPAFGSDELTFEIAENYWMAALRDVPFHQYDNHPVAVQAAQELTRLRDTAAAERAAKGLPAEALAPTDGGAVTARLLFRGLTPGDRAGPYLSQFLMHPVPFGAQGFHQRNKTLRPGHDYMTQWDEWLQVQNGTGRSMQPGQFDDDLHYLRNGRDLSQWVHVDVLFQSYFNACLVLLQGADAASSVGGGIGADWSPSNPYAAVNGAQRQQGFGTLGDPGHIAMMCEAAPSALLAVWFQKWFVHLRLRPEAYAARIDVERRAPGSFGLPASLMNSMAVAQTVQRHGTALLPMAFPEGSPMHPSYGAGHATVAGACVTVLKALFKGDEAFADPVDVVVDDGGHEHIEPYSGDALTIGGELDKLASNIAQGRNHAGV
ncbi:MAG: hypothetical protein OEY03_08470, partial [Rhizobacter sp.]|nr:hypothetical protein [Rhizobacter sp.]